jgi:hypothetical protein
MSNRSDNFNRTDSATALGTPSDGGSAWSALSGTWGISSNKGYHVDGTGQSAAVLDAGAGDCTVQVTISGSVGDDGFIFRATDNSNYFVYTYGGGALYRQQAGSFTLIAVSSAPFSGVVNPTTLKAVLAGSAINIFQDGALVLTVSDSFNATATKHGLRSNGSSGVRFDDFSIATAGNPTTPYFNRLASKSNV